MNTYDRAALTWGMAQWTGGDKSDLTAALAVIKKVDPAAFAARFQRFGIDVENNQLVVTGADGGKQKGKDAAEAVQGSATLTAVLARAGLDPAIQEAEIQAFTASKVDGPLHKMLHVPVVHPEAPAAAELPPAATANSDRHKHEKKKDKKKRETVSIRVGDVFTSEYAVGLLADRTVHGGFPSGLGEALGAFLEKHHYDPKDVKKWAHEAEKELSPLVVAGWTDRAAAFAKNGCDIEPGSFKR